jgi:flavin reductase (DIM6/NTAB) family NADH-FMN oxidoreductase RutF
MIKAIWKSLILHDNTYASMDILFNNRRPEELGENFFHLIGKEWMLITAGNTEDYNTMTASWGTTGILWNRPVAICFVRPHRHTFQFTEKHDGFTLSFFDARYREVLDFCGTHSGRDIDKASQTGLRAIRTPLGSVAFEQARLVLDCKKLYADFLKPENFLVREMIAKNYPGIDFHRFYIGEIAGCWLRKEGV